MKIISLQMREMNHISQKYERCVQNNRFLIKQKSQILKEYEKITTNPAKLSKIHETIEFCSLKQNAFYKTCISVYTNVDMCINKQYMSKDYILKDILNLYDRIELEKKARNFVNNSCDDIL